MKRLLRVQEIADHADLTLGTTYHLKLKDKTFPPVFDRIGTVQFYHRDDVSNWVKSRVDRRRREHKRRK